MSLSKTERFTEKDWMILALMLEDLYKFANKSKNRKFRKRAIELIRIIFDQLEEGGNIIYENHD